MQHEKRHTKRRNGSPFKAPFYIEPTIPYETKKLKETSLNKKLANVRLHCRSFYMESGIETDDFDYHNVKYSSKLPNLKLNQENVPKGPLVFDQLHTFSPSRKQQYRNHDRPRSADSIGTMSIETCGSLNQWNDSNRATSSTSSSRRNDKILANTTTVPPRPKTSSSNTGHQSINSTGKSAVAAAAGAYSTLERPHLHDSNKYQIYKGTNVDLHNTKRDYRSIAGSKGGPYHMYDTDSLDFNNDLVTSAMDSIELEAEREVSRKDQLKLCLEHEKDVRYQVVKTHSDEYNEKRTGLDLDKLSRVEFNSNRSFNGRMRPRKDNDSRVKSSKKMLVRKSLAATNGKGKEKAPKSIEAIIEMAKQSKIETFMLYKSATDAHVDTSTTRRSTAYTTNASGMSGKDVESLHNHKLTKFNQKEHDGITAMDAATASAIGARPTSAPLHMRVHRTHHDPYYFDKANRHDVDVKMKTAYTCIARGDGTTIPTKRDDVHMIFDAQGNFVKLVLRSNAMKKRPMTANVLEKKFTYRKKVVEVVDPNKIVKLTDLFGIKERDKLPRHTTTNPPPSGDSIDYESADRRRLKAVMKSRNVIKHIEDHKTQLTNSMSALYQQRDITYFSGVERPKLDITGRIPLEAYERHALTYIYQQMGGDGWVRKDNWLSSKPLREWYGVTTNHLGATIELKLPSNNLTGKLSMFIADLKSLEVLNLDSNKIVGPIVGSIIQSLKMLEVLSLRSNKLNEDVPIKSLGDLPILREVWLSDNSLTGTLAEEIGSMTEMTHFCVYRNSIEGCIPKSIARCAQLELLSLGRNALSGCLPEELKSCIKLTHLSLHSNRFTGEVPYWIYSMKDLVEINLFGNLFEGEVPFRVATDSFS